MPEESRKKKQSTSETAEEVYLENTLSPLSPSSSPATIKTTCNPVAASNVQEFVVPSEPPQITRMKYEDGKYDLQELYNRREFARAKVMNLDREIDAYARSLSNNAIVGQSNHLFFSSAQQKPSSPSSSAALAPKENQVSNQRKEDQESSESKKNKKRKLTLVVGTCKDSVMDKNKLSNSSDEEDNDDEFAPSPSM